MGPFPDSGQGVYGAEVTFLGLQKAPDSGTVRVVAKDCQQAMNLAAKYLTAAGATGVFIRSVTCLYALDVA